MVAELSNPAFRDKLKSRNLWQRIIDSIANLFGFRKDSSNYAKISKNLSDIIDNYDTNFTKSYENANLESKNTDFAKKDTIESNLDSIQKGKDLKLDKDLDSKEMQILQKKHKEIEKENNIKPLSEFGTNYAEFYHDPANAISKLLLEKQGQVAGAFHKEGLGDIDLVWGNVEIDSKGRIKGYGLSKIIEKHLKNGEFEAFGKGEAGLINGLNEIVENGKLFTENNVSTIIYHKNNETYRVGISKGWKNKGDNQWIITSYKVDKSQGSDSLPSSQSVNAMSDGTNLHSNDLQNSNIKIESLQDLERIFKKNNTDSVNNELFDKVFSVAKELDVKYSNEILGNRNILGQYNAKNNKITLQDFSSETILHEMIHAVSSRAIDNPQVLKPVQKHAIKNLNRIYNRLKLDSKFKGEYALNSVKEMVAELSNPTFRKKLKVRNLWQRIIDSIANLFGFRKDSSNYTKISKNLSDIIDNYDTNFTKNYENIESNFTDFAKKNTIESKDSNQGKNMNDKEITINTLNNNTFKELRKQAKHNIESILNKDITNKKTGMTARISVNGRDKMISKAAVDKSIANGFTKEEHFSAVNDIENLWEEADFLKTHKHHKQSPDIKDIHRFTKNINFKNKNKRAQALLTIKEYVEHGNRIYSVELQELIPLTF